MKGTIATRSNTQVPLVNDNSTTTITTAAYVQLSASLPGPASQIQASNTGTTPIRLATGGAGQEVDCAIIPVGATLTLPLSLKKGVRLAAKAVKTDNTTGYLVINFLG